MTRGGPGLESPMVSRHERGRGSRARVGALTGALLVAVPLCGWAQAEADPAAPLDRAVSLGEARLREGERQAADSAYRSALLEGWLLMGALHAAEGRLVEARVAFERASTSAVETERPQRSLALLHLQRAEAGEAVNILTRLVARNRGDISLRRLLAQALVAQGQAPQAMQALEEARAQAPEDLELAFTLASGYLKLKKVEAAERLFAEVAKGRPIPQTHVLIGRTYRDFGEFDRARAELMTALRLDPKVRRAHYYLGMIAVTSEGLGGLPKAIAEFRQELSQSPGDPLTSLRLGIALTVGKEYAEALPLLELAARSEPPQANAFHYLGRCQLALDRPAEAATTLRRALDLSQTPPINEFLLGTIHYQLAQALRGTGATQEAALHFSEAERTMAQRAETSRDQLARYLTDTPEPDTAVALAPLVEDSPLANVPPARRAELRARVTGALARAYLNLGVMQAQAERFARAADLFGQAAEVDPEFPQVQYSLGVARFNAGQFDQATGPLARALSASPADGALKRMLAMALLNTEGYAQAADLLKDDPERGRDPSLQYAYGLCLVRSGHAAEAQSIFSRLLDQHGDSPELSVVLGQAYAQQGDFESAIASLTRARQLKADVAEASATLGVIYLRQGRLAEAEEALRAEIASHPQDLKSQHNLATVLDLLGRADEAIPLLRSVLKAKPEFADGRYLLGKILLARGAVEEAVEHLAAAARLAPEEAGMHYQLAQAYRKLGRTELARQQLEIFRALKDKRRGGTS